MCGRNRVGWRGLDNCAGDRHRQVRQSIASNRERPDVKKDGWTGSRESEGVPK